MQTAQYKDASIVTKSFDNIGQSSGMGGFKALGDKQMNEYIEAKTDADKKNALRTMIAPAVGAFRTDNNTKNELRLDQYGKGREFAQKLWDDVMAGTDRKFESIAFMFKDPEFLKKLKEKYPELTPDNVKNLYSAQETNADTKAVRAVIESEFKEPPQAPVPSVATTNA